MERLSLTSKASYNATEATIHMARYQLAAPYCKDKRVLDVACGEGYGAYTLKVLGAASVEAVDNSPEAVRRAQSLFSRYEIKFSLHDAERVDELFPDQKFDVIVSLETIEHVRDPKRFLQSIKALAGDDTVIIISCPNDNWYYPDEEQSNPYHIKKYTFEEFRELTTSALGREGVWGFGIPLIGFGTVTEDLSAGKDPLLGQIAMLDFQRQASAIALPPARFANIGPRNCSYFAGIWGGDAARIYSSAVAPISMDQHSNLFSWDAMQISPARIGELEKEKAATELDKQRIWSETQQLALEKQHSQRLLASGEEKVRNLMSAHQEAERQLEIAHQEREYYRIQALALSKEIDIVNERSAWLRRSLDQATATIQQSQGWASTQQLQAAAKSAFGTRMVGIARKLILPGARRIRPYLPEAFLRIAQRIARALGI